MEVCQNQHIDLLRFLFTEDSLKIKKKKFDKNFYFVILYKLAKLHYQIVFTSQVIQQNVFRVSCFGI